MNFGSDNKVRNAFRATLLDAPSSATLLGTSEIDAADVLEVTDLASAIAKAEEAIRARSSRALAVGPDSSSGVDGVDRKSTSDGGSWGSAQDIFDQLVATDDTSGPAVHAPYIPTPVPPRVTPIPLPPMPGLRPPTLRASALATAAPASAPRSPNATQPLQAISIPPAPTTAPLLVIEDDAFYHPAGRIRSFADATLDGYRIEPTLMVRIRERRHALSWVVVAVLAPLVLLAVFAIAVGIGRSSAALHTAAPGAATPAKAAPTAPATQPAAPAVTATTPPAPVVPTTVTAHAAPTTPTTTPGATMAPAGDIPVFDVNSLKSAPPPRPRR